LDLKPGVLSKAVGRLFVPMRYLRIVHPEKFVYDVVLPIGALIIGVSVYNFLPVKPPLLGENGILTDIKDVLALLIAFFVAALAAIATFSRPGLDDVMKGSNPPRIPVKLMGKVYWQPVTRREFLCYLFGYLSSMSLSLFLTIVTVKAFVPSLHLWIEEATFLVLKNIFIAAFSAAAGHMLVATLLGLNYLTDRINRP
jgi:hypothetical protein